MTEHEHKAAPTVAGLESLTRWSRDPDDDTLKSYPDGQFYFVADVERWAASHANDEVLSLHRQLAAEKLRADQGWQRAEAKSGECNEVRERLASHAGASAVPDGWVNVAMPLRDGDANALLKMGWTYLDAARDAEPTKTWLFSHAGYEAMLKAAPAATPSTAAVRAAEIPPGWKLVPVISTLGMDEAGHDALLGSGNNAQKIDAERCYDAMLAAAPVPAADGGNGGEG